MNQDLSLQMERSKKLYQELVSSLDPTLPGSLQHLIVKCRVDAVQFRPLLTDGGLAIRSDGFVIYVNSSKELAPSMQKAFNRDGGRSLPASARFVIAHELAHTLFFNWETGWPTPMWCKDDENEMQKLETLCNKIASGILLPSKGLICNWKREYGNSPTAFISAARAFGVGIKTLLLRIKTSNTLVGERKMFFLLEPGRKICSSLPYVCAPSFPAQSKLEIREFFSLLEQEVHRRSGALPLSVRLSSQESHYSCRLKYSSVSANCKLVMVDAAD